MNRSPNRLVAGVFGVVYLLVGAAGFVVTTGVDLAATDGATLILFEVNPLHNVVHLAIGAALLASSVRSAAAATVANTVVGAVYLVVGLVGLFLIGSGANILALNGADNVLHMASALLLLGVGLAGDRERAGTHAAATR
ncbi:DUF4383 domain-containing protein [Actinotalea sp. Marseille-Q4924]|uniref:DUF4383 domain-containing protein n=1 Tax=Actinotalea sp. Marseille-Q4924 TaxID=2866571 RepID=UPI001CE42BB9|nr:DUF4383 domain-containing protein [Actinotalea sp. Marseille-Q4924]